MTGTTIAHRPPRVDRTTLRRDRDGAWRHSLRQARHRSIHAFGKRTHRIAAGEDADQALLVVDH
jgi:hypothetical protein